VRINIIVMAPKKAVVAIRRSVRAAVRKPKASSDSQCVDVASASTEKVVGSAKKSTNKGSRVGTRSKVQSPRRRNTSVVSSLSEPGVVRRSKTNKKRDEHTVASGKVSESGKSTVVTSEGRENATQRSDLRGRVAARMTIEDSSSNENSTSLREGLVGESNRPTTRLNLALTDENRHGDRQWLTSSPAITAYSVRKRAERDHRSDHTAYRRKVSTCPEQADEVWSTDRGGCVSIHAQKPYSREHPRERSPSVERRRPREHPSRTPSVARRHPREWSPSVERRHPREHPPRSPSVEGRHPRRRSPMSNTYSSFVLYPDMPTESRKSVAVERNLKQASTKAMNQNRRRSMSVDELGQLDLNRRNSPRRMKSRPVDSSVTVPRFDGSGDPELFLKRFMSVAQYYCWTESEQLFRLEHSMSDDAQCVLMDAPPATSVNEFIDILRSRFGFATNAEHYRAELSHLRRGSLSFKELHLEVRRLVNKAFPGVWSTSTEIYARDAFLSALNDSEL
jgi:hypothetical protein